MGLVPSSVSDPYLLKPAPRRPLGIGIIKINSMIYNQKFTAKLFSIRYYF